MAVVIKVLVLSQLCFHGAAFLHSFTPRRLACRHKSLLCYSPELLQSKKKPSFLLSSNVDDDEDWNANIPKYLYIPEEMLDLQFTRSGGSGGQNVNKVNTQVQLRMHVASSEWIPMEVRDRLQYQQRNRINKDGFLVVSASEHRTQSANRKEAVDKLRGAILQAWRRPKQRNMRTGISKKTK